MSDHYREDQQVAPCEACGGPNDSGPDIGPYRWCCMSCRRTAERVEVVRLATDWHDLMGIDRATALLGAEWGVDILSDTDQITEQDIERLAAELRSYRAEMGMHLGIDVGEVNDDVIT